MLNDKSCDFTAVFFLRRKIVDKCSDKYSPYLFIMTIKLFIFDAARVRETQDRTAENLRDPIANADPRSVCILEAPGAMPQYAHLVSRDSR